MQLAFVGLYKPFIMDGKNLRLLKKDLGF